MRLTPRDALALFDKRLIPVFGLFLVLIAPVLVGPFTPDPLVYVGELEVLSPRIRPGEVLVLKVHRCGWDPFGRPIKVHATRWLVDEDTGARTALAAVDVDAPSLCETVVSRISIVPANHPPGRYRLIGTGWGKNTFGERAGHYRSGVFTVEAGA